MKILNILTVCLLFITMCANSALENEELYTNLSCRPAQLEDVDEKTLKEAEQHFTTIMSNEDSSLAVRVGGFAGYYNTLHLLLAVYRGEDGKVIQYKEAITGLKEAITGLVDFAQRDFAAYGPGDEEQPFLYFGMGVNHVALNPQLRDSFLQQLSTFPQKDVLLKGGNLEDLRDVLAKLSFLEYQGNPL